ncbi:kinetochore protein Mis14 like-domain-containing protein [Lipomyces chichibuensis]|uniref:kinetochore protein Mis14 like-domain-containing protein n=1 Tax=Lipomyces chichibuensis TaxID=1546026 RepID=UPI003343D012
MAAAESGRTVPDFEIRQLHHPPIHQKLQLVSQDVRFLQRKLLDIAKAKIDSNFPTQQSGGQDPLKEQVEEILKQFILRTIELSKFSLVVNGIEGANPSLDSLMRGADLDKEEDADKYEPFDLELNEQVRELYAQIDEETVEVTKLRRETPLRALESYKSKLEMLDEQRTNAQTDDVAMDDADSADVKVEEFLPRRESIMADFEKLIATLREMKKSVPAAASKLDRAEAAVTHLNHRNNK